jgi:hypothetical protein
MPSDNVTHMPDVDDAGAGAAQEGPAPVEPFELAPGLDQALLGRKVKEEAPIVVAASDQPIDIDDGGITVPVDPSLSVVAPPQPRRAPLSSTRRRARRR